MDLRARRPSLLAGPERLWLETVEMLLRTTSLSIDAISVEHLPRHRPLNYNTLQRLVHDHGFFILGLGGGTSSESADDVKSAPRPTAPPPAGRGLLRAGPPVSRDALDLVLEVRRVRSMHRVVAMRRAPNTSAPFKRLLETARGDHGRYSVTEFLLVHRRVGLLSPQVLRSLGFYKRVPVWL